MEYRNSGLIREIGAIFNGAKMGYRTTLIACKVPHSLVDKAAEIVSSHSGLSHNYLRSGSEYNLWFTFSVRKEEFDNQLRSIISQIDVPFIQLDTIRRYKLSFDFGNKVRQSQRVEKDVADLSLQSFENRERLADAVAIFQRELPIVGRPFRQLARISSGKFNETELIDYARRLKESGLIRRIGALWNHSRLGLRENVLCLWQLSEEQTDDFANSAIRYANITHCYKRTSYHDWPWQIYTMIHGQTRQQCEQTIDGLHRDYPHASPLKLWTVREYKKKRAKYRL